MIAEQRETFGVQFIDSPRTYTSVAHQARFLQHAQMLRDGRPRHRQACRQFVHRAGMRADHFEDRQTGGVAQGRESVLYVSIHLR